MEQDASFGYWLMARRQSLRIQRSELATRIGCAPVTLRKIESDERRPSRQVAERLAVELAIPPQHYELFIRVARGELRVDRLEAAPPTSAGPTNLPRPTTMLAGRSSEIGQLTQLLTHTPMRLITLTGAPGVGKSRLALEVAHGMREQFRDGVFLINLEPVTDPDLVLATIAQVLHIGAVDGQPLAERLGRYLRKRQILLVLDTFEHVLAAGPALSQILASAAQLKLLVTSRVALELTGEQRVLVLPLAVPPDDPTLNCAAVQWYPALELFVQRTAAVVSGYTLTDSHLRPISEICRRMDGLPLAIELIAARMNLFTPTELLAQLADQARFLTSRARDVSVRHLSLSHAIGWSYGLLTPAEQRLFRQLSVFVGGCSHAAAQAVCGTDQPVIDRLTTLVASSLLQRSEGSDGQSLFTMLDTINVYAHEQLISSGEYGAIRERHAAYYLSIVQLAEQHWDSPVEWEYLRQLVAVRYNLQAALQWAIEQGKTDIAMRLCSGLFTFFTTAIALEEARAWIEQSLALPRTNLTPELRMVEAKLHNVIGYVTAELGMLEQASGYFARGLQLYTQLDNQRGIAWSMRGQAMVQMLSGDYAAAELAHTESLQRCQANSDAWGEAWSLYALAFLELARGNLAQARPALEAALVRLRTQGMSFGVLRTLLALGHTQFEVGNLAEAEACYREGLALSRTAPLHTFVTIGIEGLGLLAASHGQLERAVHLWAAADALRDITGERRWPVFQASYERMYDQVRSQLSPAEWRSAWAVGRSLNAAQAVGEALEGG